jgi:hypothetical protein
MMPSNNTKQFILTTIMQNLCSKTNSDITRKTDMTIPKTFGIITKISTAKRKLKAIGPHNQIFRLHKIEKRRKKKKTFSKRKLRRFL